jgi:hypothetical protein
MIPEDGHLVSEDPLVLPTKGTQQYRPDVTSSIPNLILAGDYLNGTWEVGNMEAANYNGRRAANAILRGTGSSQTPSTTVDPYRPPEWELFKSIDQDRYDQGQPNLFDIDLPSNDSLDLLSPLLEQVQTLLNPVSQLLHTLTAP